MRKDGRIDSCSRGRSVRFNWCGSTQMEINRRRGLRLGSHREDAGVCRHRAQEAMTGVEVLSRFAMEATVSTLVGDRSKSEKTCRGWRLGE